MNPPDGYVAEYPEKSFTAGQDQIFYKLVSGGSTHDYKIGDVYLKCRDGKNMKLSDITEEMARAWVMRIPDVDLDVRIDEYGTGDGRMLTSYKVDSVNEFSFFEDGTLAFCVIENDPPEYSPFVGVQVGPKPDGEFLSFPIKREELVRVFGEPDRIREIRNNKPY